MRIFYIAVMALVFNASLFSCTSESIDEDETLYETQATEGDDEQVKDPPAGN